MNVIDCGYNRTELYTRETKKLKLRLEITNVDTNESLFIKIKPLAIAHLISFMEACKIKDVSARPVSVAKVELENKKKNLIFRHSNGTNELVVIIEDYSNTDGTYMKTKEIKLKEDLSAVLLATLYATYHKAQYKGII
ncbi:hypothetical protein BPS10C_043 [Bacillus phage BPS10C]|uniref:Uncharacterized protein n=1 Tax=Bacillus phage BPS10C TaxID=1277886 RepID=W5QU83_9CAUD|nr:hypothetical protein BPS10C_043 [Bacillus phage BPS10C]AGI12040.1 hypothetical protein BPS10C_043 [Bacillus phage BPS10C]